MTDAGVLVPTKDESVFTPEHLMLPGLYRQVTSDDREGDDDGDDNDDDDGDDTDSCYCESCSGSSRPPSITPDTFELSCIYHRFISSLRIAPVFRNFLVSVK